MMKICFLTDLHTGNPDDKPFDIDLRQNFLDVIKAIAAYNLDLLIIGGDLCLLGHEDGICQWQKIHLDALGIPYLITAGNHDDPVQLQRVFDELPTPISGELYYQKNFQSRPFFFLDTSQGKMSKNQKQWLRDHLVTVTSDPIIVMHHPPMLMGVPHMDQNHALQDRDEVLRILLDCSRHIDVLCGHYHVEKMIRMQHVTVHVTPSCYLQIDASQVDFAVDHKNMAFRLITLVPDEQRFASEVRYVPGNEIR
ncbi:MAG: hypothetical protein HKN87_01880 [Saprospiraceae bacterium]|nr:hypothetical protein [Saprospiraceae bacterium]